MMATKRKKPDSEGTELKFLGLKRISGDFISRWDRLARTERLIQETRFAHVQTLNDLGLLEPVQQLLKKVGLQGFLQKGAETYKRYALEFLSTLERHEDEDEQPYITFHLNDVFRRLTYKEVGRAFGWDYTYNGQFENGLGFNEKEFWFSLTGNERSHGDRSTAIVHPAVRYIHRLLSMTVFCHGETTHITKLDVKCLWSMIPQAAGCPDWTEMWVKNCLSLSVKTSGKISMGGMVTLLANFLEVEAPSDLKPLGVVLWDAQMHLNSYFYSEEKLVEAQMLRLTDVPGRYIWLHKDLVPYMVLPQKERLAITRHTTVDQLFIPPDDDAKIPRACAVLMPPVVAVGGNCAVPMLPMAAGGGVGAVPMPPVAAGGGKPDFQSMVQQRLDSIEQRQADLEVHINGIEDKVYSIYSMVSAMNAYFVSQHRTYKDPSAEIEESRQHRHEKRASSRASLP